VEEICVVVPVCARASGFRCAPSLDNASVVARSMHARARVRRTTEFEESMYSMNHEGQHSHRRMIMSVMARSLLETNHILSELRN
jgi:hypothetical protein